MGVVHRNYFGLCEFTDTLKTVETTESRLLPASVRKASGVVNGGAVDVDCLGGKRT